MDELLKIDTNFNEAMFKTKVDNVFVKLHTAVMLGKLEQVKHFLSDEVYNKYDNIIKELDSKNQRQMYDELNVKSTEIESINIFDDRIEIKVKIISRYMDYILEKSTGNYISGNNTSRVEKNNILTFTKKIDTKELKMSRKCPSCGANMDINNYGKCDYCGMIFNLENYDYILTDIVTY